jgi:hypothetical protein
MAGMLDLVTINGPHGALSEFGKLAQPITPLQHALELGVALCRHLIDYAQSPLRL